MEKANIKLNRKATAFIITVGNQTGYININLVKYLLDMPYTKKDGKNISQDDIYKMKERAKEKYVAAINSNQSKSA